MSKPLASNFAPVSPAYLGSLESYIIVAISDVKREDISLKFCAPIEIQTHVVQPACDCWAPPAEGALDLPGFTLEESALLCSASTLRVFPTCLELQACVRLAMGNEGRQRARQFLKPAERISHQFNDRSSSLTQVFEERGSILGGVVCAADTELQQC